MLKTEPVLVRSDISGLKLASRGKVRDMYDLGESLLIVTTDRLSAFDVVMANGIPFKGKVLNRLSEFWFKYLGVPHHMITCDVDQMPAEVRKHRDVLRDRAMLVKKARTFPVECVARGYLIGSGWKDYQSTGAVCGIALPTGRETGASYLYARHEGGHGPRREHRLRSGGQSRGRFHGLEAPRAHAIDLREGG